jgi:hypothetical protein
MVYERQLMDQEPTSGKNQLVIVNIPVTAPKCNLRPKSTVWNDGVDVSSE